MSSCSTCHCECVDDDGTLHTDNQGAMWCDRCPISSVLTSEVVGTVYDRIVPHGTAACSGEQASTCSEVYGLFAPNAYEHEGPDIYSDDNCLWGNYSCLYDLNGGFSLVENAGCQPEHHKFVTGHTFGICCIPRDQPPPNNCGEYYTGEDCCAHMGGSWQGTDPANIGICQQQNLCPPPPTCCGCDWCCNDVAGGCTSLKKYEWENLPAPSSQRCVNGSCATPVPKPVCRRAEFLPGKRPLAHVTQTPSGQSKDGRYELHSEHPIRAIDELPQIEECRTYYGHVGEGPLGRYNMGWLCGQWHRSNPTTKRANQCYINKRADGRHSFECAYRVPCPEKPTVCL